MYKPASKQTQVLLTTALWGVATVGCGTKSSTDQSLLTDIQSKLYADAVTKPAPVVVAVKDGVVTLSGNVPSQDVELEAMKIANGTAGVRSVDDQMKLTPAIAANQSPQSAPPPNVSPSYAPAPLVAAPLPPPSAPAPRVRESAPPPPSAPRPEPAILTIPAGERISVRMIDSIDSRQNSAGQVFRASLYGPLSSGGRVIVRPGANVSVVLAGARGAGRIAGRSDLVVRVSGLEYHGRSYPVESSVYEEMGKARGKQTAIRTGVGAAAGAIIGAIAGGGKGAAIGSAAGGGAGFGVDALTHGQQVRIPSETVLTFTLEAPLRFEP